MFPKFKQWFWKQFQEPKDQRYLSDPSLTQQAKDKIHADPNLRADYRMSNFSGQKNDISIIKDIGDSIKKVNEGEGIRNLGMFASQHQLSPQLKKFVQGLQQRIMAINKTWSTQARHNQTHMWNAMTNQAMEGTEVLNKVKSQSQVADDGGDPREMLKAIMDMIEGDFHNLFQSLAGISSQQNKEMKISQLASQITDLGKYWEQFKQYVGDGSQVEQPFGISQPTQSQQRSYGEPWDAAKSQSTGSFMNWLQAGQTEPSAGVPQHPPVAPQKQRRQVPQTQQMPGAS